jgi:glycogen debranching enzyme
MSTADPISLDSQYSIVAQTDRPYAAPRVLKHGGTFIVFDPRGDVITAEASESGLYHAGTRFLSRLELLLVNHHPLLLSSTISDDNDLFSADLTNPDLLRDGQVVVPHGSIHLSRCRVLLPGMCVERVRISSYLSQRVVLPVTLRFAADFADVFEVRGTRREVRGERLGTEVHGGEQTLRYRGLDGVERRTRVQVQGEPDVVDEGRTMFVLTLQPGEARNLEIQISCEQGDESRHAEPYASAARLVRHKVAERAARGCQISTSNDALNRWLRRSTADLYIMETQTPHGVYPYAGIPWFCAPFGRDGLITALQLLWADPDLARGVLLFLAATQATSNVDEQDAQPGKILHEMREGEMSALGEVPFARYYGSADATPLFVLLAHAYFERTGDREFIDQLWPHIVAALDWMRTYGDPDRDGFIEYARKTRAGLVQQGWKDSHDSVFHADGTLAEPPIALCDVQAYAYGAWEGAARLALARGHARSAAEWYDTAVRLQTTFDEAFWCESIQTYALALDGAKQPCRVRTSNAGHCLFTGIANVDRAPLLVATLMSESSFAGWGIRTVASGEARYNPLSYHNGSIWPHDNALVASGLARYGAMADAARVMNAMLDLSQTTDLHRLPELICGFHRRTDERPTLYPVACAPQSWAAGAVYMLLQACLGLRIDASARRVTLTKPVLPPSVDWLEISRLRVGASTVDLHLQRHANDVGITVLRREGAAEIVAVK